MTIYNFTLKKYRDSKLDAIMEDRGSLLTQAMRPNYEKMRRVKG